MQSKMTRTIDQRQSPNYKPDLYRFQFRKVSFVSFRIECHETIRLRQGMRSNDEIGKQTPRPLLGGSSPASSHTRC
jgi:hypothetical protein